jgi:hypothetical protein
MEGPKARRAPENTQELRLARPKVRIIVAVKRKSTPWQQIRQTTRTLSLSGYAKAVIIAAQRAGRRNPGTKWHKETESGVDSQ